MVEWKINKGARKLKEHLVRMEEEDWREFIKKVVKVKIPGDFVKISGFRYSDVYSYNYKEIQDIYGLEGNLNASLIRNTKNFIAMEYPTKHTISTAGELLVKSKCEIVISLIGNHPPWEEDFLEISHEKSRSLSGGEFLCFVEEEGKDISKIGYARAKEIVDAEKMDLTVEIYTHKEDRNARVFRIKCHTWADKTPPSLNMLKAIDILYKACILMERNSGPVIIHCMAGIGRTGTFILYSMLRDSIVRGEISQERKERVSRFIDLFIYLRSSRTWMVENKEQIGFLYDIFISNTDIQPE